MLPLDFELQLLDDDLGERLCRR